MPIPLPTEKNDPRKGAYHGSDYTVIIEDRMPISLQLTDKNPGDPTAKIENIAVDVQSGDRKQISLQVDNDEPEEKNDGTFMWETYMDDCTRSAVSEDVLGGIVERLPDIFQEG